MVSDFSMSKKKAKVTKSQKPKTTKKVTRRRRKMTAGPVDSSVICDLEQIYRAINRVQVTREETKFLVKTSESAVLDNILKDLTLPFDRRNLKIPTVVTAPNGKTTKQIQEVTEYTVRPNPVVEKPEDDFKDMDEFPDELLEEGQIFGL
jgi:hypothetical protein